MQEELAERRTGGDSSIPPRRDPRWRDFVGLLLAAAGAAICVHAYALRLSYFGDEILLLESVLPRGWGELAQPLGRNQAAPLGFVYLLELSIAVLGENKLGFRAVPMAAAVASMFLFWVFIRGLVHGWPAWFGMAVFACGSYTAYYAQQTKQYTLELAVALGLLCLTGWVVRGGLTLRRVVVFGVAGAGLLWFSISGVFILGGCGLVLSVVAWRSGRRAAVAAVVGAGLLSLASFAGQYLLVLQHYGGNAYLHDYWNPFYLRLIPRLPFRLLGQAAGVFTRPVDLGFPQLGLLVSLLGVAAAARGRSALAWAVLVTWGLLILASWLERYPYGDRQVLFALPLLIGLVALGLRWLADLGPRAHAVAALAAALMLVEPVFTAGHIEADDALEPVLAEVRPRLEPGDTVWVERGAVYPYYFLASRDPAFDLSLAEVMPSDQPDSRRLAVLDELERFAGRDRVWLLISHSSERRGVDARNHILFVAEQLGRRLEHFEAGDTSATLFDFTRRPEIDRSPDAMPRFRSVLFDFPEPLGRRPDPTDPESSP
ncbi:MAG: hypothetical protein AAF800_05245 [Planctomycetota bacterium]